MSNMLAMSNRLPTLWVVKRLDGSVDYLDQIDQPMSGRRSVWDSRLKRLSCVFEVKNTRGEWFWADNGDAWDREDWVFTEIENPNQPKPKQIEPKPKQLEGAVE